MICPQCKVKAVVEQTFAESAGTARRGTCPQCRRVLTEVAFVTSVNPNRGQGAAAMARKIREGRVHLKVDEGAS